MDHNEFEIFMTKFAMGNIGYQTQLILVLLLLMMTLLLFGSAQETYAKPIPLRVHPSASQIDRLHAARELLQSSPLIDGHNDLAWNLRKFLHNRLHSFNFSIDLKVQKPWRASSFSHTDLIRLKRGHVAAQFWSVYVPCEAQYLNTVQVLMEQLDVIKRMISSHSTKTVLATSSSDIIQEFRRGRLASLLGVEGGHAIASSMGVIRTLYDLGVRYMTLTHKCHTPWAESSERSRGPPNAKGLTSFGKDIIREMNRLGMLVDISHASMNTVRDVLSTSTAPIMFSHSASRSLCDIERNLPDDILHLLPKNGGIVMISFYNEFLTCTNNASIYDVISHINHVRTMAGVDHVGLGAGYDGMNKTPDGLSDVSSYPYLFAELLRDPTWSYQDLKKLAGLNFLRVLQRAEEIRDQLKEMKIKPSEEIISIHDIDSRWPCRYKFSNLEDRRS